jgi:hypothetical protein
VNDDPVAAPDGFTVDEGSSNNTLDVLANDTDVDIGDTLTITAVGPTSNGGTVTNNGTDLSYTAPASPFTGIETFSYTIEDTDGMVPSTATVTVSVIVPVNQAPVADDDFAETNQNVSVLIDVVTNDNDVDNNLDPTSVVIIDQPSRRGTVVNNLNGTVTFTPRRNFRGTDTFTYTVKDLLGAESNVATVRVNVVRP